MDEPTARHRSGELIANKEQTMTQIQDPPPLGQGQPWLFRSFSWVEVSPNGTRLGGFDLMAYSGMTVHEELHAAYWDAYLNSQQAIAVCRACGVQLPTAYALVDINRCVKGHGRFEPHDGPHEMAWLSCMFIEMRRWRLGLALPEGILVPDDRDITPRSASDMKFTTKSLDRVAR
jgi:hypothetical protein